MNGGPLLETKGNRGGRRKETSGQKVKVQRKVQRVHDDGYYEGSEEEDDDDDSDEESDGR
jgi:hypothetical protein